MLKNTALFQKLLGKQPKETAKNLPNDFSPNGYLKLNPDLKLAGIDPANHYAQHGASEGRCYQTDSVGDFTKDEILAGVPSVQDNKMHQNSETKRSTLASHENMWKWIGSIANKPGFRVLEIGSRSVVSDARWKKYIPKCDYTGFDIIEGKNVDIVGDAHRLTDYFAPNSFDLIISWAVFEHLAMPWLAVEEISKVLDVGGYACIETHFSYSEHELPWHFFQFNSRALEVLFCPELGFELIDSGLDNPIVGRFSFHAADYLKGRMVPELYCHSGIIAKKARPCPTDSDGKEFDWRKVAMRIASDSMYPEDTGMK